MCLHSLHEDRSGTPTLDLAASINLLSFQGTSSLLDILTVVILTSAPYKIHEVSCLNVYCRWLVLLRAPFRKLEEFWLLVLSEKTERCLWELRLLLHLFYSQQLVILFRQPPLEWLLKQPLDSQLTVELKIKTTDSGTGIDWVPITPFLLRAVGLQAANLPSLGFPIL